MKHNKNLIRLGIAILIVLVCGAMLIFGGNLLEMLQAHLGI